MNSELRWKQRFQNFEKAFLLIEEIAELDNTKLSNLEKSGIIQRFEILIELSWKVMKDYLEYDGYDDVANGKKAIRQAFVAGIITDAEGWMDALQQRNLTSHTYNNEILEETVRFIQHEFYPLVRDLHHRLNKEL